MLNSAGHTMLLTHTSSSGNQIVIESSASDGAGVITTWSPAITVEVSAVSVCVGGTKPSVNGACAGLRYQGPSPALTSPSGPSVGSVRPNWCTSPRRIVTPTSVAIRSRLTRMRSCPQIGYPMRCLSASMAVVPAT